MILPVVLNFPAVNLSFATATPGTSSDVKQPRHDLSDQPSDVVERFLVHDPIRFGSGLQEIINTNPDRL